MQPTNLIVNYILRLNNTKKSFQHYSIVKEGWSDYICRSWIFRYRSNPWRDWAEMYLLICISHVSLTHSYIVAFQKFLHALFHGLFKVPMLFWRVSTLLFTRYYLVKHDNYSKIVIRLARECSTQLYSSRVKPGAAVDKDFLIKRFINLMFLVQTKKQCKIYTSSLSFARFT